MCFVNGLALHGGAGNAVQRPNPPHSLQEVSRANHKTIYVSSDHITCSTTITGSDLAHFEMKVKL